MKRSTLFSTVVVLVFVMLLGMNVGAKTVTLKFIETSDVHGSFFPYDFIKAQDVPTSLAQIYAYIQQERANADQHVILLDNGDILQGQPTVYYYNFEKTDATHICAEMMNFMGYAAASVGNHDLEAGHPVYDKLLGEFAFPWLAANAVKVDSGEPYFQPYTTLEKDGVKIAILGLITPKVPSWLPENLWEGMQFEDMIATAKTWVPIIQEKEQPDVLIGLFHAGVDFTYGGVDADTPNNENASKLVAEQVPGFDIVFVGHDHQGWNDPIKDVDGGDALILGTTNAARTAAVGTITLTTNDDGQTWSKEVVGEIIETEKYAADEAFMAKFAPVIDEIKAYVDKPIGTFTKTISTREAMFGDSAFVDLIHRIQLEITNADVSFAAPLSFDASINEGEVYVRDAFQLYVYENLLYTMMLTGKEIKDFLEYSYGGWFNQMSGPDDHLIAFKKDDEGKMVWSERNSSYDTVTRYYNYDSAAGIIYTVDVSKPAGERIMIASMADGSPFDMAKEYLVALNSYRGTGGGGHLTKGAGLDGETIANRMRSSTIKDLRFFLMKWIEKAGVVEPAALGNWNAVPADWWEKGKELDYKTFYEPTPPTK